MADLQIWLIVSSVPAVDSKNTCVLGVTVTGDNNCLLTGFYLDNHCVFSVGSEYCSGLCWHFHSLLQLKQAIVKVPDWRNNLIDLKL